MLLYEIKFSLCESQYKAFFLRSKVKWGKKLCPLWFLHMNAHLCWCNDNSNILQLNMWLRLPVRSWGSAHQRHWSWWWHRQAAGSGTGAGPTPAWSAPTARPARLLSRWSPCPLPRFCPGPQAQAHLLCQPQAIPGCLGQAEGGCWPGSHWSHRVAAQLGARVGVGHRGHPVELVHCLPQAAAEGVRRSTDYSRKTWSSGEPQMGQEGYCCCSCGWVRLWSSEQREGTWREWTKIHSI